MTAETFHTHGLTIYYKQRRPNEINPVKQHNYIGDDMAGSLKKAGIGEEDCAVQGDESYPETFSRQGSLAVLTGLTKFPNLWLTHNSTINARAYNGGVFTEVTIAAACTAIGDDVRALYLEPGTWLISNDLTIPSNIVFVVAPGAVLTDDAGNADLTINGYLEAGLNQIFDWGNGTGTIVYGNRITAIYPEWYGALGDRTVDCTAAIQEAIYSVFNSHAGAVDEDRGYPTIIFGAGSYSITQILMRTHVRLRGMGQGWSHSSTIDAWQTELFQPAGTNLDMLLFNAASTPDLQFILDAEVSHMSLRGEWTGIGDATTTTGSGIKFDNVTPGQNVVLDQLQFHDLPEHGIEVTRHALPGMFRNLWGRKLGGSVIDLTTQSDRVGHMIFADNIHGDYTVGPVISIDESGWTAVSYNTIWTYLFTNIKHEIDPAIAGANPEHAYSGVAILLHNVAGVVTVINANSQVSLGSEGSAILGEPEAVVKITSTGTRRPHLTVIGSRMGSVAANDDPGVLVLDDVLTVSIAKEFNSCCYNQTSFNEVTVENAATIIEEVRQITSGGTRDDYPRFERDGAGKLYWGSGAAEVDVTLQRSAANVLSLANGDGLGVGNSANNTNKPSGATTKEIPIYNENGTLLGYIPVYAAQW